MRVLLFVWSLGCSHDSKDTACDSAEGVDWEGFADGFFATYCRSCHSSELTERYGAPEGVDFDAESEVRAQEERIRARVLTAGDMPPGGGVVPGDLELLSRYLDCGGGP